MLPGRGFADGDVELVRAFSGEGDAELALGVGGGFKGGGGEFSVAFPFRLVGVVVAAGGYPLNPEKGQAITGLPADADDAMVFHAGTTLGDDGVLRTSGGRVLCVTALGDSAKLAQQRAYEYLRGIQFDGMQFRSDIGWRAIKAR